MTPILDVDDLCVHFDTYEGIHRVLNGIDLTVNEGETVALVGETGCGKSVTGRSIMGTLQQPPAEIVNGEIRYRGTNLLADPARHELIKGDEMSMVFQDPMTYLSPVFTIGSMMNDVITYQNTQDVTWKTLLKQLVMRTGGLTDEQREQCVELFRQLRIPGPEGVLEKYPVELSGGMRQRVIIAMALINDPTFLIADEPTTALDVTVQNQILDLLKERVRERNLSMLYITHNIGVARELADRIYIMYAGEIVEVGETEALFETPLHPYTQGMLGSIPKLTGFESGGIEGQIPDYTAPPTGCRFHPRCPASMEGTCDIPPLEEYQIGEERRVACFLYDEEMSFEDAADEEAYEQTVVTTTEANGGDSHE